ncbi:hypothetical protein [Brachyspira aalborgi]|uniref:Uncharacterized protein n=1 Tax=Brachyspira aalborgi TaxID=29522 RepID=A0A5C8G070_9SPIR|nr:hypothetical protein [Brachyspira aalborgi]TXJ55271.1 hypothetical protein EPJ76_06690 [Brachyspira aalborgi]
MKIIYFITVLLILLVNNIIYCDIIEKNYSIKLTSGYMRLNFTLKADNLNDKYIYIYADNLEIGIFFGKDAELDSNGNIIIIYDRLFNKADSIKLYTKCKKEGIRNINFYNSPFDNTPILSLPISQFPNFVNNFIKEFEKF